MDSNQQPNFIRIIVISVVLSLFAGFIGGGLSIGILAKQGKINLGFASQSANNNSSSDNQIVTAQEQAIENAVKIVSPAVVSVIATQNLPTINQSSPFDFFGFPFGNLFPQNNQNNGSSQPQEVGGGTGFIISSDGLILTNKHVVDISGADYTVLTNDGQKYPTKILAVDPNQDIAILKIDKKDLPTVKLGDSDNLQMGQSIIAIGNALGEFRNTVSVGVVSGLSRSITASGGFGSQPEQLEGVVQTDAAINPGNSGGPLINLSGEVIGINVAMAQGAQNIGFALPINLAKRDISQVQANGKISYPYIGVRYILVNDAVKSQYNLSVNYGALILSGNSANEPAVVPGSPAAKAGLEENDIILEVNGQKINSDNTLSKLIQSHNVGDTLTLKILRGGQEKNINVTLGEQ